MDEIRKQAQEAIINLWKESSLEYDDFLSILDEVKNEIIIGHIAAHTRARLKQFGFDIDEDKDHMDEAEG